MKTRHLHILFGTLSFLFLVAGGASTTHALTPEALQRPTSFAVDDGHVSYVQPACEEAEPFAADGYLLTDLPQRGRVAPIHLDPWAVRSARPAFCESTRLHAILSVYLI